MKLILIVAALLVLCVSALAAERPDLSGTWRASGGDVLIIEQSGDDVTLRSGKGADRPTEVKCNTMGKQCEGTVAGDSAKVSYWFNGPALIEMAIEGKNRVTETRRRLSDDGKQMIVEVITIAPGGKDPEKVVLTRQEQLSAESSLGR